MIREAEEFAVDAYGMDVFDGQLNFDEYFKAVTVCSRPGKEFPKTRKFW